MSREAFFDAVRHSLFGGHLNQAQVDALNRMLGANEQRYRLSRDQLAYVLATAYHETGHTMQPVEEVGKGRGHVYGLPDPQTGHVYYGRGYVQLTWKKNYAAVGERLGIPLVQNPELALDPCHALDILFHGMMEGWFTGRELLQYIHDQQTDFINARRIINCLDRAADIAEYAKAFSIALA